VLELPADPSSPARARRFVVHTLDGSFPRDVIESAALLVSELATNVVLHAGTPMRLSIESDRAGVRVEVADESTALPVMRIQRDSAEAGRGLVLVDRIARAWGVERLHKGNGKVVWFELGVSTVVGTAAVDGRRAVYSAG